MAANKETFNHMLSSKVTMVIFAIILHYRC